VATSTLPGYEDSAPTTILVIDDHEILATALMVTLRQKGFDAQLLPVTDLDTMVAEARQHRPGIALLDLDLGSAADGDRLDGTDLVRPLRRQGWKVLVVTGMADLDHIAAAIHHGATSWIIKTAQFEELTQFVAEVALGGGGMPEEERAELLRRFAANEPARSDARRKMARLTVREREILTRLADGDSPAEIAAATYTALGTVRTHIRAILTKLEVKSQLAAVAIAHRHGAEPSPIPTNWWRRATRFTRRRS
jgi:DNA-binding NarL/FixJ family response regulator